MLVCLDTNIYIAWKYASEIFNQQVIKLFNQINPINEIVIWWNSVIKREFKQVVRSLQSFINAIIYSIESELKKRKILKFSSPAFEVIEAVITREIRKLEKSTDVFDYTKFRRLQFLEYNLVTSLFGSFKSLEFSNIQKALASYIKSIRNTIFQTYIKTVNLIELNKKWSYSDYSEDKINQSILSDLSFIPNNNDRMILGHFLTELDNKDGIFITNDHKDFLSRRKQIENKFSNVRIISPVYFCVVWNSRSKPK